MAATRLSRHNLKTFRILNYCFSNYLFNSTRQANMSGEAFASNSNRTFTNATCSTGEGVSLKKVVDELTRYAPLALAESWDNVGLLVEPFTRKPIKSIMLTNDLTKNVMTECVEKKVDMIIAYHPPIFVGKKRITNKNWQDQLISCCLENRIAVYSPHTTWDSVPGGLGDWLASAFGDKSCFESVNVLEPFSSFSPQDHSFSVVVKFSSSSSIDQLTRKLEEIGLNSTYKIDQGDAREFVGSCSKSILPEVYNYLSTLQGVSYEVYNRVPLPQPGTGGGRLVRFKQPMTIRTAIDKLKCHLGVQYARIAYAVGTNQDTLISSAALVPGSGGKVLAGVHADLYVTGEMLHHDVLAATHNNSSVLMTTHSDSERGFLTTFSEVLDQRLNGQVAINISSMDRDPIEIA